MHQSVDRTETQACAKKPLVTVVRTCVLLTAAVLASILAVDLPAAERTAQPYVPASGTWIELGAEEAAKVSGPLSLTPEHQHRS